MTVKDALAEGLPFVLHPSGEICQISLPPGQNKLSLTTLQTSVGGYIEMIPIRVRPKSWKMFANEDGIRLGLPVNPHATALCTIPGAIVLGPVVLTRHA